MCDPDGGDGARTQWDVGCLAERRTLHVSGSSRLESGPDPYRKPGEVHFSFGYFRRLFVVAEPGSRVIFIENHHYPQALIDCPKDSIRFL